MRRYSINEPKILAHGEGLKLKRLPDVLPAIRFTVPPDFKSEPKAAWVKKAKQDTPYVLYQLSYNLSVIN